MLSAIALPGSEMIRLTMWSNHPFINFYIQMYNKCLPLHHLCIQHTHWMKVASIWIHLNPTCYNRPTTMHRFYFKRGAVNYNWKNIFNISFSSSKKTTSGCVQVGYLLLSQVLGGRNETEDNMLRGSYSDQFRHRDSISTFNPFCLTNSREVHTRLMKCTKNIHCQKWSEMFYDEDEALCQMRRDYPVLIM